MLDSPDTEIDYDDLDVENYEMPRVTIARNATFADLYAALDAASSDTGDLYDVRQVFGDMLHEFRKVDREAAEQIFEFDDEKEAARGTRVINFFKLIRMTPSTISAFFPINFEKRNRRKPKPH